MKVNIKKAQRDFVQYLQDGGKSSSTISAYNKDLEQLAGYLFGLGISAVDEVTSQHLSDFIAKLTDEGKLAQKSVSRKINSIKSFFKYLATREVVDTNVAQILVHPKLESKEPKILSQIEYMALREVSRRDLKLYTMVETLLQTGIRISELAGLETTHLDLGESSTMFIPKRESQKERVIPLTKKAKQTLITYLANLSERQGTDGFLFATRSGKSILIRNIRASMERLFKRAGLKDVTVNDLRHTFTAHQLANGVSLQTVCRVCGHKTLATTQKYLKYIKLEKAGSKEILEEL